jgi:hypothetical protein
MKKLFTILCAVTLTANISFSQSFGVKLGLNSTAIGVSDDNSAWNEEQNGKIGLQIGGVAMFEISDMIDLRTGLSYSQKGTSFDVEGYDEMVVYSLDYLEVPLNFAFNIGGDGFSLNLGPYLGFLINSEISFDGESDDWEDISSIDFGLDLGASYLVNETILIDVKYGLGLANISDDSDDSDDFAALNGGLQLSVAYVFGN